LPPGAAPARRGHQPQGAGQGAGIAVQERAGHRCVGAVRGRGAGQPLERAAAPQCHPPESAGPPGTWAAVNLDALIALLSRPESYTAPPGAIRVCQTHISVVFLTNQFAYKLKKPVNLGFLDFSTLEKRRHFCEEEVRLNRRL